MLTYQRVDFTGMSIMLDFPFPCLSPREQRHFESSSNEKCTPLRPKRRNTFVKNYRHYVVYSIKSCNVGIAIINHPLNHHKWVI